MTAAPRPADGPEHAPARGPTAPRADPADRLLDRYRLLSEHARDIILFIRPRDGRVVEANAAAVAAYGYDHDALLELTIADLRDPATVPQVRAQMAAADRHGARFETVHRRRDGTTFPVEVSSHGARIGGERLLLSIVRDVTDRNQAADALRDREAMLRTLGDNLPAGVIYQGVRNPDRTGRFTYISAGVERVLGVPPADVLADPTALYALIHPDDLPRVLAAEDAALAALAPFDCEFRSYTRAGDLRWVHCRSAPRRAADGTIIWDGLLTDVTARKQTEAALREADRRKDEFLATLAHELRNPLAPIRNAVQLLRVKTADPDECRARDVLDRQVKQLTRLVDDLLDVARITGGKVRLAPERVAVAAVVGRAVETSRPLLDAAGHRLAVALPAHPVWLDADPTRLAQVVANLLNNAAKYTPPGGSITVTAECGPHPAAPDAGPPVVEIRVADTGIGIPAADLPGVFELFTQVDAALDRAQGGLGIGLTIARRLVELHGGSVAAHSDGPGTGSTFTVRLPCTLDPAPEPPAESAESPAGAGLRVLVVDDSPDSADTLAMLLQLSGYETCVAHGGAEGVAAARHFRPEAVLLDIGMPGMNGFEVARRLREMPEARGAVLVAVTGWGHEDDRRRTREVGFDHHLVKPVDPACLREILAGVKRVER